MVFTDSTVTPYMAYGGTDLDFIGPFVHFEGILLMLLREAGHFLGYNRLLKRFHEN